MNTEYQAFLDILREELIPAMGCTEPIAVAYCAALARRELGKNPDRVLIEASGNIIKNVKSVVVPNTDERKGLDAAAAVGIVAGDPEKKLQVISEVTDEQKEQLARFLEDTPIEIRVSNSGLVFDIIITEFCGDSMAKCRIINNHTNVVTLEKDGNVLIDLPIIEDSESGMTDRSFMSIEKIYNFALNVNIDDVRPILDPQIEYNMAIAEEGLRNRYGANIGATLLASGNPESLRLRSRAMAAAGSDARMSGCELPVVINSGSGNQGITASVPVVVWARAINAGEEKLYRALTLSNLIAVYQKTFIGRLSAYCGAISAGAAAGCAIAYLDGAGFEDIVRTLVNAIAISSGIICDGAKASCAAKIALAVDTGIFGYEMVKNGNQFYGSDGIVRENADAMVRSVGQLASEGMKKTDDVILQIMLS